MTAAPATTSRFKRDVRCETSGSDRDVTAKCHAPTVTFQAQPFSSFLETATPGDRTMTNRVPDAPPRTPCEGDHDTRSTNPTEGSTP